MEALRRPTIWIALSVLLIILLLALRPGRTTKKTTESVTTTQTTSQKVGSIAVSETKAVVSKGTSAKTTTSVKTTTRYDPATSATIEIIQETTTTEDLGTLEVSSSETTQTASEVLEVCQVEDTTTETKVLEETPPAAADNSKLGVAVTTSARVGVTYDVVRVGRLTGSALLELDPKEHRVSGAGAGVNADISSSGRYFVGVHQVYDFRNKSSSTVGCIGMRF